MNYHHPTQFINSLGQPIAVKEMNVTKLCEERTDLTNFISRTKPEWLKAEATRALRYIELEMLHRGLVQWKDIKK